MNGLYSDDVRQVHRRSALLQHTYSKFDVHRAVHRNIISIVKPTRCNSVSNLFYFGMTIYMFRTVFPSIIRNSRLYILQQAFVKQILLDNQEVQPMQSAFAYKI